MNVLMTGSSGTVGTALTTFLTSGGHQVRRLLRTPGSEDNATWWNPVDGTFAEGALDGIDAVVHLAGEGIAAGRWTEDRKARIRDSRVIGTQRLSEALAKMETPPKVFVAGSALGFYGDRGDELMDESSSPGTGFLSDVCQSWEDATTPVRERGVRVVNLRMGLVLRSLLSQMLLPFRLGVGGVLGPGDQYMSWVALDDVLRIALRLLTDESISGPVNAVSPNPATNQEFTKTLGRVIRRPTIFPMPAFAARLIFGEMADALLLASTRVDPAVLKTTGFEFEYPQLEGALRQALGR